MATFMAIISNRRVMQYLVGEDDNLKVNCSEKFAQSVNNGNFYGHYFKPKGNAGIGQ